MINPYQRLPSRAFWRSAVAEKAPLNISGLWNPKWPVARDDAVVTFGSCFAQYFGRALKGQGYSWLDAEPPLKGLATDLNYGVFSARTGNIYTAAALKQWVFWALGLAQPPAEVWETNGRFFDPFRPAIERDGFATPEEMIASRERTLSALRDAIATARVFVFTMGLTEGWINRSGGYDYAMCPGTVAGEFDTARHTFKNYTFSEIYDDMSAVLQAMREYNKDLRFLLTVSPVPLTATASGKHVVTATTYSKSVLRAVAGMLADSNPDVDYFPAYEIIASPPFQAMFYNTNKRTVTSAGVEFVMSSFFGCLQEKFDPPSFSAKKEQEEDLVCEERMLEAFGPGGVQRKLQTRHDALKVCIIGNSHLAALRLAVREGLYTHPDVEFVFWGLSGKHFQTITYDNGRFSTPLVSKVLEVSDGRYGIVPAQAFDAFVFHGVPLWPLGLRASLLRGRPEITTSTRGGVRQQIADWLPKLPAYALARALRADYSGPILISTVPFLTKRARMPQPRVVDSDNVALIHSCLGERLSKDSMVYVPQPPNTTVNLLYTRRRFNIDGPWLYDLNATHRPDTRHMNGTYGAEVLRTFSARIRAELATGSAALSGAA
jgi:hypothetical protein